MDQKTAIKSAIKIVADRYGITTDQILSNSREKHLVSARKEVYYLLREKIGLSYSQIGDILGKNHATVIHALKGYESPKDINVVEFHISNLKNSTFDNGFHLVQPRGGKWSRIFRERGAKCEIIGCGFNDVLEVHHFISKKVGGTDEPENLILVCPNHHTMIHQDMVKLNPEAYPFLKIPSYLSTKGCE